MRFGLHNAAKELQEDIQKYGIIVNEYVGVIGYKNQLLPVPDGATRVVCRRYIKTFINQAVAEEEARRMRKQTSLFEMDCAV